MSTGSSKKEIQSVIRATIVTFSCRGCYKSKPIYIVALSGGQNFCQLKIQKQKSRVLLDTGAEVSLMNRHVFDSLKDKPRLHNKHAFLPTVNGEPLKLDGCTEINFEIEGIKMSHSFFVVCVMNINLILRCDWLEKNGVRMHFDLDCIMVYKTYIPLQEDMCISSVIQINKKKYYAPTSCYLYM